MCQIIAENKYKIQQQVKGSRYHNISQIEFLCTQAQLFLWV